MTSHKHASAAFWATALVVVLLAYPTSYGPAEWLYARGWLPQSSSKMLTTFYWPILWMRVNRPEKPISRAFEWYYRVGLPLNK